MGGPHAHVKAGFTPYCNRVASMLRGAGIQVSAPRSAPEPSREGRQDGTHQSPRAAPGALIAFSGIPFRRPSWREEAAATERALGHEVRNQNEHTVSCVVL